MDKESQRQHDLDRLAHDYKRMTNDLSRLRVQATRQASVLRAIADVLDGPETAAPTILDVLPKVADLKRLLDTRAEVAALRGQLKASLVQAGVKLED
ncbi:MAG: hypothetical protein HY820_41280 [Acidobacteria bacterium]|nr:hypothetical protein [Acidobacteriota bacterium]